MIDTEQKNIRHTHVYTHAYTETHRYTQRGEEGGKERGDLENIRKLCISRTYMEHKSKAHSVRILANATLYLALAFLYLEILGPIQLNWWKLSPCGLPQGRAFLSLKYH